MGRSLQERILKKASFEKNIIPPFPKKNMLIEVTNCCNHKCVFCANSKMTRPRGFINKKFAFRMLSEAYELGTREVGFYATGEPLLNKDIFEYIKEAKGLGYTYVYLTTNGALLDKNTAIKIIDAGIDSIKFSINAGTRETYKKIHGQDDFYTVINNVKFIDEYRRLNNVKLNLFVSCILNSLNINEKENLEVILNEYIDEVFFLNVRNQGGMMYEINEKLIIDKDILLTQGRIPCSMVFNSLTITHEGYLTSCCVDFQNYLVVADLNKMSLSDAWECNIFQRLRQMHLQKQVEGTICYNCIYNKKDSVNPLLPQYATLI